MDFVSFTAIQQNNTSKYSVITEFLIYLDESLSVNLKKHRTAGTEQLFGRDLLERVSKKLNRDSRFQITLSSADRVIHNEGMDFEGDALVLKSTCRWVGTNTGMNVVVDVPGLILNVLGGFEEYISKFVNPKILIKYKSIK